MIHLKKSVGVGVLVVIYGCVGQPLAPETVYLDSAIRTANWLRSTSSDGTGAVLADELPGELVSNNLGSGPAGRAIFFAELYAATGDSTFRDSAAASARAALSAPGTTDANYGLYTGLAGVAAAISETARVTGDAELATHARELFRRIADAPSSTIGGPKWSSVNDVLAGKAGIGLSLLYAYEMFGDQKFLESAVDAGDNLLAVSESTPSGGVRWMRGEETPLDLPNFSHGTAGVGFFMARLAATSGATRFHEAALASAVYLSRIADKRNGLFLVPYGIPNEGYATPYDIGWAHGPAGTARLHYQLFLLTADPEFKLLVEAGARTIIASGAPGPTTNSALWAGPVRIDRRFGTAGAAAFLADWGTETGGAIFLEAATRMVDDIIMRATPSVDGLHWRVPRYGFQGDGDDATFTGYFYGSAGFGLALLHQHYATTRRAPAIRLPDDPYPKAQAP